MKSSQSQSKTKHPSADCNCAACTEKGPIKMVVHQGRLVSQVALELHQAKEREKK